MKVVVGVDSGGSKTRALAVSLEGERMGYAEAGGGHLHHDGAANENLRHAIRQAAQGHEIVRLVAGIAGLDSPSDEARILTVLGDWNFPKRLCNDAAIAHYSAFGDGPGIVSIQGTGSTIRAVLEDGRIVTNGDFQHYARSGAVWVGLRAVHKLLKDPTTRRETTLLEAALSAWGVDSVEALRDAVSHQRALSSLERSRRYGVIAQAVTASAEAGGFFSQGVCAVAVREIVDGINILGPMFAANEVPVAFVGACIRSPFIRNGVKRRLESDRATRYRITEAEAPPLVGAIVMAFRDEGVDLGHESLQRLAHPF